MVLLRLFLSASILAAGTTNKLPIKVSAFFVEPARIPESKNFMAVPKFSFAERKTAKSGEDKDGTNESVAWVIYDMSEKGTEEERVNAQTDDPESLAPCEFDENELKKSDYNARREIPKIVELKNYAGYGVCVLAYSKFGANNSEDEKVISNNWDSTFLRGSRPLFWDKESKDFLYENIYGPSSPQARDLLIFNPRTEEFVVVTDSFREMWPTPEKNIFLILEMKDDENFRKTFSFLLLDLKSRKKMSIGADHKGTMVLSEWEQ